jgi:glutathione synthase/RimK-type ligase-like ATP-grasp enzyme
LKLAFLVPAPDYAEEWRWAFDAEAAALVSGGIEVDPVPWTEAGDLTRYDLVLPLVVWGYHERPMDWFGFLDRVACEQLPMVNPPALLRWNSDKQYLAELGERGIATVPTLGVEELGEQHLREARERFGIDQLIVKPPISGSAFQTFRLGPDDPLPDEVRGQRMIVQPFIRAIADGEYSLILFDNVLSHCVVKRPQDGEFRVQPQFGGMTEICKVPARADELAQAALAAAPEEATYARVDIIRDDAGELAIMELELIEPALFLHLAPQANATFAAAVRSAAERARK